MSHIIGRTIYRSYDPVTDLVSINFRTINEYYIEVKRQRLKKAIKYLEAVAQNEEIIKQISDYRSQLARQNEELIEELKAQIIEK